jgi:hypothetical protein
VLANSRLRYILVRNIDKALERRSLSPKEEDLEKNKDKTTLYPSSILNKSESLENLESLYLLIR